MSEQHDSETEELRAFELHGARIGVRLVGAHPGSAEALLAAARPVGARTIPPEDLDAICEVQLGDGGPPVHDLASDLDFAVAEHATERVFLHAGVVAWDGEAIVIPGRSLSGKTTLTAALVRAGATFYSDEFASIDREGRVWPHARPLSIRAPGSTEPGRPVPVEDLGFEAGLDPIPVGLIVHTRHVAGARWQPVPLDAGAGLLRVLDNAVVAQTQPQRALSFLAPVTARARVLDGVRGDADETASLILQAVGRPADGGAPAMVAVAVPTSQGLGPLRHLLIRMVLAARGAGAVHQAAGRQVQPGLALAPIPGAPSPVDGEPDREALAWSSLYDLAALHAGCGVVAADLESVEASDPAHRWDRVDAVGALDGRDVVEALAAASGGGRGALIDRPQEIGWGAGYGSLGFWEVVAALRPSHALRVRAARVRPPAGFLGVHWRRGPYAATRPEVSPSAAVAAEQIATIAEQRSLTTVVIATDAEPEELAELREHLGRADDRLVVQVLRDAAAGDPADLRQQVVEQAVLAESTWFVGTRGSSWTMAVREARVASGRWIPEASWSVLCGDAHHPPQPDDLEHGPIWELPRRLG